MCGAEALNIMQCTHKIRYMYIPRPSQLLSVLFVDVILEATRTVSDVVSLSGGAHPQTP